MNEMKWISVKDRLPDIPGDEKSWAHVPVIVAIKGSKKSTPMIYERAVIRGKNGIQMEIHLGSNLL